MKIQTRLVPAVVGLLIVALTACTALAETPERTPSAVAPKAYSEPELAKLVMFGPEDEEKFTVTPSQSMRKARDQTRAAMSQLESEPSACGDLSITSVLDLPENAAITAATNGTPTAAGTLTISLLSDLDAAVLEQALHSKAALVDRCPKVVVGTGAGPIHVSGQQVTTPTRTQGSVAVQTSVTFPTGEKKTTMFITAVKGSVVLSVQTTGNTLSETDIRTAAEMLDRVADRIS